MISLKTFLPVLGPILGTTPAVLYERQRVLVRMGVLHPIEGRGPGSGVPLSSMSLATLLIAYAAADTLSDVPRRVTQVCHAVSDDYSGPAGEPVECRLTKCLKFLDALETIIFSPDVANRVAAIEVELNGPGILVIYDSHRKKTGYSSFSYGPEVFVEGSSMKGVMKKAIIDGQALRAISETLMALRLSGALGAPVGATANVPSGKPEKG